jgi:DNA-binding IclR family transcriptional regulator
VETQRMTRTTETTVGTVARTVQTLRYFAEHPETTIKEIAAALGLAPSTCHRLLDLLAREGIIEHDKVGRRYRIGVEFFRIAAQVQNSNDVTEIARPFLRRVVEQCDETCVLCLYDPTMRKLIFMEKVDSARLLRYQLPMNVPLSVLWGASGRAVLAYLPQEEVDAIYEDESNAPASGEKLPSRAALGHELELIRERGYAISTGQKIVGATGVNAPVFNARGRVIGSLGVTAPESRVSADHALALAGLVRSAAADLSAALGFSLSRQARSAAG